MKAFRKRAILLAGCLMLLLLGASEAGAMISIGGSDPMRDMGWPDGTLPMANLPTRFAYWEGPPFGGGDYHFQYACKNSEQFNEALLVFGGIQVPRLELVVVDGMPEPFWDDQKRRVDWEFEAWHPRSFYELNQRPGDIFMADSPWYHRPLPPPRVTLYLGPECPIDWKKVEVPGNVTVIDKRVANSQYKDSKGGVACFTVRDMASLKLLPGATVALVRYDRAEPKTTVTLKTDAAGMALFRDMLAGRYQFILSADGYATRHFRGESYQNYGRTYETYDLALAKADGLKGTVKDNNGKPLEGVKISDRDTVGMDGLGYTVEGAETLTDREGRFELKGLPTGYTRVDARKAGYYYFSREIHEVPGRGFSTTGRILPVELNIIMAKSGSIGGKVTGCEKAGKSQVMVRLDPEGNPIGKWGGSMICKPDGSYEFTGVPEGHYTLHASLNPTSEKQEAQQTRVAIDFKAGESREVDLEVK